MEPIKVIKGQKPYAYPKTWEDWINQVLYNAKPYSEFENKLSRIKTRIADTTFKGYRKKWN
jgi:hypothetical protein